MVEPAMLPSKPSSQSTSKITRMVQSMWGTVLSDVVPGRISRPSGCRDLNRSARKHEAEYQRMKESAHQESDHSWPPAMRMKTPRLA